MFDDFRRGMLILAEAFQLGRALMIAICVAAGVATILGCLAIAP